MGLIKGILKVGASAVLAATGTASTILKGMSDTVGLELGSEIFGAAKDASFNGIKNMWGSNEDIEECEGSLDDERKDEVRKLKVKALRCKELAEKASDETVRQNLLDRYESLMAEAEELSKTTWEE